MERAILHVGYPKTASTWFQKAFYPKLRDFDYVPQKTVKDALNSAHNAAFNPEIARRTLTKVCSNNCIAICKEDLTGWPQTGGRWGDLDSGSVAERLWATFGESGQVVIIVRNQLQALVSIYGQYLRRGGSLPPRRYILPLNRSSTTGASDEGILDLEHFNYDSLITRYETLFGADRVHVFAYEALAADPHGFLEDFSERLGLGEIPDISLQKHNTGYGGRMYVIARLLNRLGAGRTPAQGAHIPILPFTFRKALLDGCARLPFTGTSPELDWLVGTDAATTLEALYSEGNRRLVERHNLPFIRFAYPGFR